ncbi:MAG: endonuclease [Bacilli bacterium]
MNHFKVTSMLLMMTAMSLVSCGADNHSLSDSTSDSGVESSSSSVVSTSIDEPSASTSTSTSTSTSASPSTSTSSADYYAPISDSLSGSSLSTALHNLTLSKHTFYCTYGDIRYQFGSSDADPNVKGNAIYFYSRASQTSTWDSQKLIFNREHVWPQSLSGGLYSDVNNSYKGAGSDLHHIRPEYTGVNGNRGNTTFGEITGSFSYLSGEVTTQTKISGSVIEVQDAIKGDVARILLYLYLHYYSGFGNTNTYTSSSFTLNRVVSAGSLDNAIALMIKWNKLDPVDSLEEARNTYVSSYQGNKNPFIDHPEYACRIWGNTNSATQALCA